MALTVRTNGSGSSNQITAQWFNDYHDLLTGVMVDQEVTIKQVLALQAIAAAPSAAMTGSAVSGGSMGVGVYKYTYTFVTTDGESVESPVFSLTTTSSNKTGSLATIATGPTGTTARNLYRTVVGGTQRKFLHQIADNTTTGYTDSAADGTLGANAPTASSFGGSLVIKDYTGAVTFRINNDGSFTAGGSTSFGNTTIGGTLSVTGTSSLDNGTITTNGAGAIGITGIITANGGINTNTLRDNTHGNTALDMSAGTGQVAFPYSLLPGVAALSSVSGSVAGTATMYCPVWGPSLKIFLLELAGYNSTSIPTFTFPTTLSFGWAFAGTLGASATYTFYRSGTAQTVGSTSALGGGSAGTSGSTTNIHGDTIITIGNKVMDSIQISSTAGVVLSTFIVFIGW